MDQTGTIIPSRGTLSHGIKFERFNGTEFKHWQQEMLLYLTNLGLARFLTEDAPVISETESCKEKLTALKAWKHSEHLCKMCVLNGLDNTLFSAFCSIETARELWESLDKKFTLSKQYIISKFLDFKMTDSKTVISQIQELQVIINEIHDKGIQLTESFQVVTTIDKLPPSWNDFKNYLEDKEINMKELVVLIRTKEDKQMRQS